jgi:hypothetical protein
MLPLSKILYRIKQLFSCHFAGSGPTLYRILFCFSQSDSTQIAIYYISSGVPSLSRGIIDRPGVASATFHEPINSTRFNYIFIESIGAFDSYSQLLCAVPVL